MSEERTYRTKSGRVLTDADIEELSAEAERGYDVDHLVETRVAYDDLVEKHGKERIDRAIRGLLKQMEAEGG